MEPESKNLFLAGAVVVLLLGLFVRTIGLGSSSLWLDEVHSYERASRRNWSLVHTMLRSSGHAPLYEAVLLHYWMKLGTSEYFLRLPSAMLGTLNIALVIGLGRAFFGGRSALLASLLLALSPLHIRYSRELRMYTLASVLTTLAGYSYYIAAVSTGSSRRRRHWVIYILCGSLSLYTHYITALVFATLLALGLILTASRGDRDALRGVLLVHFGIFLLFAPWLPTVWAQLQHPRLTWIPPPTLGSILGVTAGFFVSRPVLGSLYPVMLSSVPLTALAGLIQYVEGQGQQGERQKTAMLLVSACATSPLAITTVISLFKPLVVDRYFVMVVPWACLLLGLLVLQCARSIYTAPAALVLLVGMTVSAYGVATTEWKEDWRGVAAHVLTESSPDDAVLLAPGVLRLPFNHYYQGSLPQLNVSGTPTSSTEVKRQLDTLDAYSRFWIVRAERFEIPSVVSDYIEAEYGDRQHSCRTFDAYFDVTACLYYNSPG